MINKNKEVVINKIISNIEGIDFSEYTNIFDCIILYHYLTEYYKNNSHHKSEYFNKQCDLKINFLINNLKNYNVPMGVWYGFTGLAYILRARYGEHRNINVIEEFIKNKSLQLIVDYPLKGVMFSGMYDLLNGLTGILNYFLIYNDAEIDFISKCLNWIVNLFDDDTSLNLDKIIIKEQYITNPQFKKKYRQGYIDLGSSHGLIDFLYVLSLAKKKKIKCKKMDEVIEKILIFYKNMFKIYDWEWPSLIEIKGSKERIELKSRYSWCYGKLGVIRLLYIIGGRISNNDLQKAMILEMKKINIENLEQLHLSCPTFCHGYSGLYHISNLFYKETKDLFFKELSDGLEKVIWDMGDIKNKYYFYKHDVNEIGKEDIYEYGKINSIDGIISILIPYISRNIHMNNDIYSISLFLK